MSEIYNALQNHQIENAEWELTEFLKWLHEWRGYFALEVAEIASVAAVSLCVDHLPKKRYGHFRHGVNGFGLKGEIALNRLYVMDREPWEILGTLFHELLHAWQEEHGKPGKGNFHNKEFRAKALEFGLIIDSKGVTQYAPDSVFLRILTKYGVEVPEIPEVEEVEKTPGKSKLKKWSCQCEPPVNLRVAVPEIHVHCLECDCDFTLQG